MRPLFARAIALTLGLYPLSACVTYFPPDPVAPPDRYGSELAAATIEVFDTGTEASFRGLAAVSEQVCWATGSGPTVAKTTDGGATWENVAPASIEGLDVRDVIAFDPDAAWIMTAGPGEASRILETRDGGATWTERHRETEEVSFLDGMDVFGPRSVVCYGDSKDGDCFHVIRSWDVGATWETVRARPAVLSGGEASFAASGTGIRALGASRAWICTGANDGHARVLWTEDGGGSWNASTTPIPAPAPSAGAFSIAVDPEGRAVVVGGDFAAREMGGTQVAAWSEDFGQTWASPSTGPRGQRAGSVALGAGRFIATGQTGTDISLDGGRSWSALSDEGFHCVEVSPSDGTVWFSGPAGRVGRLR